MITCQYCGAQNPVGASFCDTCGGALSNAVAAQASQQAQAQLAQAAATAKQQAVHASQTTPHFGTGRLPSRTLLRKRYLILKTVGKGGMAAVYHATDTKTNRPVAIKEMSQEGLTADDVTEALQSFTAEARLLQSLNHPNLPKVYESFSEDARHYLVMDFIEGVTLEERLQAAHAPLPEAEVLQWAAQLCNALTYLHTLRHPVIFRDLKPSNIMLTPRGQIKLIDFGIARIFSPNRRKDTQALGTPGYAPPEQYGSAQTDPRADIYALGATLYQLLTDYDVGKTPFTLPPMHTRNASVSPHVQLAIQRATRLNRAERYATIAEFQRDLLSPAGYYFRTGELARTPQELLTLLRSKPQEGAEGLYAGRVAGWMTRWKRRDLADTAKRTTAAYPNHAAGLQAFLAATPSMGQRARTAGPANGAAQNQTAAGQRGPLETVFGAAAKAATAGIVAAGTSVVQSRIKGQQGATSAGDVMRVAAQAAAATFARTAGSTALPTVQPRMLDLGRIVHGQDATGSLTVSGQGAPITGAIKSLSPWLSVDKNQISGPSALVTVTARTSALTGAGHQTGTIEVSVGSQRMYIPVQVDVTPAPGAAPRPAAKPPQAQRGPIPAPGFVAARVGTAQPQPNQAHAPRPTNPSRQATQAGPVLSPNASVAPTRRASGLRFALSLLIAIGLALGAPIALATYAGPQLAALIPSLLWQAWTLIAIGAILGVAGALMAHVIGAQRSPGRVRTALLGAAIGALFALNITTQLQLTTSAASLITGAQQLGALALLLPVLAATGAALGAQPLISRGILATARFMGARHGLVYVIGVIAGGWLGFTVAQIGLNALFHPDPVPLALFSGCGLLAGVALGVAFATPTGAFLRQFGQVHS